MLPYLPGASPGKMPVGECNSSKAITFARQHRQRRFRATPFFPFFFPQKEAACLTAAGLERRKTMGLMPPISRGFGAGNHVVGRSCSPAALTSAKKNRSRPVDIIDNDL